MKRTLLLVVISLFLFTARFMAQSSGAQISAPNSRVESLMPGAQAGKATAYMELGRLKLKDGSHQATEEAYFWFYLANKAKLRGAEEMLDKAAAALDKYEIIFLKGQAQK